MTLPDSPNISESTDVRFLLEYLADRDEACPHCAYNLRGLQTSRCPECGEMLVLRVNVAEPKQRMLLAGLVALAAGAGLNGLLLIYYVIAINRYGGGGGLDWFRKVNSGGLLVEGIALFVWLRLWRKIRRLSFVKRLALMLACFALTFLNIIVFSLIVR